MKVLIVDDEKLARDRISRMLADVDGYDVVGEAGHGVEAIEQCQMEEPPAVVFCTAYEEHAIEAFNVQAVGYLLKPVRREDLVNVLRSAKRANKAQLAALMEQDGDRRSHISARTRRGIELIPIDEVRFFQADQKYVTVRHGEGELLIDETLRELEDEFGKRFVRVHRNALVASRYIEGLERDENGHFQIRMRGVDERVDISRRHLSSVRKYVQTL
jgi:two-component system response regulator AlgR